MLIFQKAQKFLWALFLVTLPVTSFPQFPAFMGDGVLVRPLSLYPLFFLLIFVTLPRLITRPIPKTFIPFFLFLIVAVASTLISFSYGIEPNFGTSVESRALRNLFTLAIGAFFYLTVALFPETSEELSFSLKWLYLGFFLALLWGSLQIVYIIKFDRTYFNFLNELQHIISSRKLFSKRISGLTYEPSWFAEQITLVLMPYLFASILSNYSIFRWRFRLITVEMILLAWATIVLLFTYSRGGLGLFIVLLVVALMMFFFPKNLQKINLKLITKRIAQISLVLVLFGSLIFLVGQKNGYFSRLWNYWSDEEADGSFLYYIAFDQRFTYWETAFDIFEDHPFLGVGLGNYTYYFDEYLPDRQYRTPEIYLKLVPDVGRNQIVTVKNLFIRILAEMGVSGFSVFLAFLIALLGCTQYLTRSPNSQNLFWGRAGILGLVAFVVVTMSVDSFAIPNMWVVFGFITASSHLLMKIPASED